MIYTVHRGRGRKAITIVKKGYRYPDPGVRAEVWAELARPGHPIPRVKVIQR